MEKPFDIQVRLRMRREAFEYLFIARTCFSPGNGSERHIEERQNAKRCDGKYKLYSV